MRSFRWPCPRRSPVHRPQPRRRARRADRPHWRSRRPTGWPVGAQRRAAGPASPPAPRLRETSGRRSSRGPFAGPTPRRACPGCAERHGPRRFPACEGRTRITVARTENSASSAGGSDSIAAPNVFIATSTAPAMSDAAPSSVGGSGVGAGNRAAIPYRRYGSGGPLQDLLELGPRPLPRPAATLLERDERARVDDLVFSEIPLLDVQFAPPGGNRGAGAGNARIAGVGFHPPSVASRSDGIRPTAPRQQNHSKCCTATEIALRFWQSREREEAAMTVMIEMPVLTDNQIGACTRDPERWMTATDDQTKAVCRACPRRWLCARGLRDARRPGSVGRHPHPRGRAGPHLRVEAAQVVGRARRPSGAPLTSPQPARSARGERAGRGGPISKNLTRLCSKHRQAALSAAQQLTQTARSNQRPVILLAAALAGLPPT